MCDVSVLFLPTLSDVFVLQTDASGRGVGAVLSVCRDGDELPVGYFSRKLKPAERKYSATELECLAVVQAIDYFAAHLIGRPFMVETDHKALQYHGISTAGCLETTIVYLHYPLQTWQV